MAPKLLLCDCGGTQSIDADGLALATGLTVGPLSTTLCTDQIDRAADALSGDTVIACAQMADVFFGLAEEMEAAPPVCVDIRDRAGWSADAQATAKMAALIAEAQLPAPQAKTIDITSAGLCLVIGRADIAVPASQQLAPVLSVTCLADSVPDLMEPPTDFDLVVGRLRTAAGALGQFEVTIDALQEVAPDGRGALRLAPPRDGGSARCDIILDLRGDGPLFAADRKRDGYFRADPGDPIAVARAVFDAAQAIGTFEKPLHVRLEQPICAHTRARQTGCTRCLDACPTGAITSDGDAVAIDPHICAGCGACAALCPTGAITADDPPVGHLFNRLNTLASAYRNAGGTDPRLLVHDADHGAEMIRLAARHGRGLPADVIPLATDALAGFGHAELLAAFGVGFVAVDILLAPTTERQAPDHEVALTQAILSGAGRDPAAVRLLDISDPDGMSDALFAAARTEQPPVAPILPLGGRRDTTRLAARALAGTDACIPLPDGAPYGAVTVDTDACTLCLSCAGLCPAGALSDNPDQPQLLFRENACVQCGLCVGVCPENAIELNPRLDLSAAALTETVKHEEEPYACIECGALFGVKSTVERIVEKLAGNHSMFTNSNNADLIRMCDTCRVKVQFTDGSGPMSGGARPPVRTTDDYLKDN